MNNPPLQKTVVSNQLVQTTQRYAAFVQQPDCAVVEVQGADALDLLNRLSTNDLTGLRQGQGAMSVLVTDKARIIDVLAVIHTPTGVLLLGSKGTAPTIVQWLRKYIIVDDAKPRDVSNTVCCIDVEGPRAADLLHELTGQPVATMAIAHVESASIGNVDVRVVRLPPRHELRYRMVIPQAQFDEVLLLLRSLDTTAEIDPHTDEYLRIMSGMGLIGCEWTDAYNPLEAGLLHMTSFSKGCYIGQEVIARLDTYNKVKYRLFGFEGGTDITVGHEVVVNDQPVGIVTSVTPGINPQQHFALGYVRGEHALEGTIVTLRNALGQTSATLRQLPMVER